MRTDRQIVANFERTPSRGDVCECLRGPDTTLTRS
jgi:hypothetical protein